MSLKQSYRISSIWFTPESQSTVCDILIYKLDRAALRDLRRYIAALTLWNGYKMSADSVMEYSNTLSWKYLNFDQDVTEVYFEGSI